MVTDGGGDWKPLVLKTTGQVIGKARVEGGVTEWVPDEPRRLGEIAMTIDAGDHVLLLTDFGDIALALSRPGSKSC